jgi:hypothetical protein
MKIIKLLEKTQTFRTVGALSLSLLAGCGPQSPDFAILGASESTYQGSVANNKVDLLFVIDNSGSMIPQQTKLANSLSSFANVFVTKGFDFHVGVITTDMADPAQSGLLQGTPRVLSNGPSFLSDFQTNVQVGDGGSAYELPFDAIIEGLSDANVAGANSGFLRADAHLAVIVISNEDQDNVNPGGTPKTVSEVVSFLNQLKPEKFDVLSRTYKKNYTVSAVVAPSVSDPECVALGAGAFDEGPKITALANLTNGSVASICKPDFSSGLTQISQRIAEAITEIALATVPNQSTIKITFNGSEVPQDAADGWTYSSAGNKIIFHGDAIPTDNTSIAIDYIPNDIIR